MSFVRSGFRSWLTALVTVGALLLGAEVFVAPPLAAQDAEPMISVSPSVGLLDGQQVTVSGSGFLPNTNVFIVSCPPGAVDGFDCDFGSLPSVSTDANGSFVTTFSVSRFIFGQVNGQPLAADCAVDACTIGVGDINQARVARAPISFFDVPVPTTKVSVTPVTDLRYVFVSGSGFLPNRNVTIVQCGPGVDSIEGCDRSAARTLRVGAAGTFNDWAFAATRDVAVVEAGVPGLVDCLVETCTVLVVGAGGQSAQASVDFSGAPDFGVTMTATPGAALGDSQIVTIEGTGFVTSQTGLIYQCGPDDDILEGCAEFRRPLLIGTDENGSFSVSLVVRRDIAVSVNGAPVFRDCATEECGILLDGIIGKRRGFVPLDFTDTPRPPTNPGLMATPIAGQPGVFTVTGSGFPQGGEFNLLSCDEPGSCRGTDPIYGPAPFSTPVLPDSNGAFSVEYQFPRRPDIFQFQGELDCLVDSCTISASIRDQTFAATDPLEFTTPNLTITLGPLGTLEAGTNDAVAQATIACDIATPVSVEGIISQVGIEAGFSFDDQPCTPAAPLLAVIPARTVITQTSDYTLGPAQLSVSAAPYSAIDAGPATTTTDGTIQLVDFAAVEQAIATRLAEPTDTEIRIVLRRAILARFAQDPVFAAEWRRLVMGAEPVTRRGS